MDLASILHTAGTLFAASHTSTGRPAMVPPRPGSAPPGLPAVAGSSSHSGSGNGDNTAGRSNPFGPAAVVHLSPAGMERSGMSPTAATTSGKETGATGENEEVEREQPVAKAGGVDARLQLSSRDLEQLRDLRQRDREVRTHEQAHLAVAGRYARGGASFSYQRGPDGNPYAIGGRVNVDLSHESTPQETIVKMQTIRRAALAPANPSPADRQVAARAAQEVSRAQQEVAAELLGEQNRPPQAEHSPVSTATAPSPSGYPQMSGKVAGNSPAPAHQGGQVAGTGTLRWQIGAYARMAAVDTAHLATPPVATAPTDRLNRSTLMHPFAPGAA